jgi:hypothetical protein
MDLKEFVAAVPGFATMQHPDRILHFGWYLHKHVGKERFSQADVRACYLKFNMQEPNFSDTFRRLVDKRPKVLLQDNSGYKLEHKIFEQLEAKYGTHETTIALSALLKQLPGTISDKAEQLFLSEAITCYHSRAFRAAIIMVWNLTYDHLLNWILADTARTAAFKANIAGRVGPKKAAAVTIAKREDFEDLKESEVLDICGTAGLFASGNIKKVLDIQLTKRNMAAHPTLLIIGAPEAEESISTLIQNVVLVLQ